MKKLFTPIYAVYLVRFLQAAAYSAGNPFLLLHITKNLGYSESEAGSIIATRLFVPIVGSFASGFLIAKWNIRKVFLASLLGLAVGTAFFINDFGGIAILYVGAILSGISVSMLNVAFRSSVALLSEEKVYTRNFANVHSIENVGYALGPALSLPFVANGMYGWALILMVLIYLAGSFIVWGMVPAGNPQPEGKEDAKKDSADTVWQGSFGWAFLLFIFVFSAFFKWTELGIAMYFLDYFDFVEGASFYYTAQSVLIVIATPFVGRWMSSFSSGRLFTTYFIGSFVFVASFFCLGFFRAQQGWLALFLLTLFSTAGEAAVVPSQATLVAKLMGRNRASVAFGIFGAVVAVGSALGSVGSGILLQITNEGGALPSYWLFGGAIGIFLLVACYFMGILSSYNTALRSKGMHAETKTASVSAGAIV